MKNGLILLLSFIWVMMAQAQSNYYVALSGNDGNSGTSIGQAWRTIQHAMGEATPNSVVHILAGTYNEKVEVYVSGTAGNRIVFRNYEDDVVVVSGTGISYPDAVIGIFDQSFVTIQGLQVANNEQLDAQGIIVEGNCQAVEIRDNDISNINFSSNPNMTANATRNSQPLIVYGSDANNAVTDLVIDGNTVRDSRTGYSEGLAVNGNVNGFVVTNNVVRDIANIGIDVIGHEGTASSNDQARNGLVKNNLVYDCKSPYATAGGIYVDGGKDIVIEQNTIYQCQWGIEVGCENIGKTTSNITVRNNFIYNNDDAGLAIGGFDFPSGSGKVVNCAFMNNTCYNNDVNANGIGGVSGEINITYTENCTLENNIFYATNSADILLYVADVNSINLEFDYNQFYMQGAVEWEYEGAVYSDLSSYQTATGQDANSIFSDPSFVDTSLPDLHISATSSAKDAGNPNFVPSTNEEDIDGEYRLNGGLDCGADEHYFATGIHVYATDSDIDIYPNPFVNKVVLDGDFDNYEIKVFGVGGVLITDFTGTSSPLTIDLSTLGSGIFFVSVRHLSKEKLSICKIIKE